MRKSVSCFLLSIIIGLFLPVPIVSALETVTVALPSKAFQFVIFPIAQRRGYMKEEGIDLKIVFMETAPGIQAVVANSAQFSGSGSSALIGIVKGNAPLKTVFAVNDQVLQWVFVRPNIAAIKDLKGKKIAVTGVASIATSMFKQIGPKYGLDATNDVVFIAPTANNRVPALVSGAVDGAILGTEERYTALDHGMKELLYLGNEVKNSWGTIATSDRFIKEQPKVMSGVARALVKALRVVRQDREGSIGDIEKFSEMPRALATRMYDDIIKTFTSSGVVDEETQKNDLVVVKDVAKVTTDVPIQRAYDFSFALEAEKQLSKSGWRP